MLRCWPRNFMPNAPLRGGKHLTLTSGLLPILPYLIYRTPLLHISPSVYVYHINTSPRVAVYVADKTTSHKKLINRNLKNDGLFVPFGGQGMNQLLHFARVEIDGMHLPCIPALGCEINMSRMTQHCSIYHFPPRVWGGKTLVGREKSNTDLRNGFLPTHPPHSLNA